MFTVGTRVGGNQAESLVDEMLGAVMLEGTQHRLGNRGGKHTSCSSCWEELVPCKKQSTMAQYLVSA